MSSRCARSHPGEVGCHLELHLGQEQCRAHQRDAQQRVRLFDGVLESDSSGVHVHVREHRVHCLLLLLLLRCGSCDDGVRGGSEYLQR